MALPLKPVQIIPPGFLGAFQLKNMGTLPDEVLQQYRPTIDMRDWLLMQNREDVTDVVAVAVGTASTFFTAFPTVVVPQDEWWFVHESSLFLPLGAGDTVQGTVGLAYLTAASFEYLLATELFDATLTAGAGGCALVIGERRGFFVPPGSTFGANYGRLTSVAGFNASMNLSFTRLPT